jgi:glutamine amidotransferase PdxT
MIATFHPELTSDPRVHRRLVEKALQHRDPSKRL